VDVQTIERNNVRYVERCIVERSRLHFRRGKAISITYSELPSIQSALFTLSHKRHDFREKFIRRETWC
jgi:hypothetical protein